MPLPFLKPKAVAGVIVSKRKPDGIQSPVEEQDGDDAAALESCAEDMIRAINAKDSKALASAIRSAFECLESEPHDEGGDEDYDSQNVKAAEEAME